MIRDYVKSSLVFYDDITKQVSYDECYYDGVFKLYTPQRSFIPFAIKNDETFSTIATAELVDEDGNTTDLIADYDFDLFVDYYTDGTSYWLHYSDVELFDTDLPTGKYYIRIIDGSGNEWFSEWFYICDADGVYDDDETGTELLTGWTVGFGFGAAFTSSGKDITRAADANAGGTAYAYSNAITVVEGNTYKFNVDPELTSGELEIMSFYFRTATGDGTADASNEVTLSSEEKKQVFYLTATTGGTVYLHIKKNAVAGGTIDAAFTMTLIEATPQTYGEWTAIEWWNDCDIDDQPFEDGFRNKIFVDYRILNPKEDITRVGEERFGEFFEEEIILHTIYKIQLLVPEWLFHSLLRLPLMDNVSFYTPEGESCAAKDVQVSGEWIEKNYLNHITIEFRQDEVIKTGCCASDQESSVSA